MLLKQMEYFCALVERGSFTKAAAACFVSQSAISQQIKQLESDLGCSLLKRSGHGFALTPAGEAFYRNARDIVNRTRAAQSEARRLGNGEPERLVIGYLNRFAGSEIAYAVAEFCQRHLDTAVTAQGGAHGELYAHLLNGGIDLKINDRRRQLSDEFINERIFTAHLAVEVSPLNPLARQTRINVPEIAGQTGILLARDDTQTASERAYHRDALNFPCEFTVAQSLEEGRLLVSANRGILFVDLPEQQQAHADQASSAPPASSLPVVRRPLYANGAPFTSDYYAFWLKEHDTAANREFATILKERFARLDC